MTKTESDLESAKARLKALRRARRGGDASFMETLRALEEVWSLRERLHREQRRAAGEFTR